MKTSKDLLLQQALQLSEDDREVLALELLASLTTDEGRDASWELEIDRRLAEVDNGTAQWIPLEDVLEEMRAEFK